VASVDIGTDLGRLEKRVMYTDIGFVLALLAAFLAMTFLLIKKRSWVGVLTALIAGVIASTLS
jgi:hypothetical protein